VKTGQRKEKEARKREARGRERKEGGENKREESILSFFNSNKSTFIRIQIMLK
jgi:hypothetical protein